MQPDRDMHQFEPRVAALITHYWPARTKHTGQALPAFTANMQHLQIDMIKHYAPRMDADTLRRARKVVAYLRCQLAGQPAPLRLTAPCADEPRASA